MTHTCRYSQTLGRISALFALALLCTRPLAGQTEVQIMVNGSWDYVEDPNPSQDPNQAGQQLDRIVLVAPMTDTHQAYIFSGDNATKFALQPPPPPLPKPGVYYVDIQNLTQNSGHKPSKGDVLPINCSNLQPIPQTINFKKIKDVLYKPNKTRMAVSLPTPDYYTTYSGKFGPGISESKVDVIPITTQLPGHYTTWMVLHYWVNGQTLASLNGKLDDSSSFQETALLFGSDTNPPGTAAISVVMGAAYRENDFSCDTISQGSFDVSTALWGITRYAKFPKEDISGNQYQGVYQPCAARHSHSAGSADCHTCQMSINGAVQNPGP